MKLLVFSYFYPPHQGIGGKRIFRWARHLPAEGIMPTILTTPWPPARDRDLDQDVIAPQVEVVRGYVPGWVWRWYHGPDGGEYTRGPLAKLLGGLGGLLGTPIDDKLWFAPGAAWRAIALGRAARFGAVLSSSSPYSSHLAAAYAADRLGVPLVVDLRDPWTFNFLWKGRPALMRALDARAERFVFRRAARVIFAAEGTQAEYERRYPWLRGKALTIYSGFDADPPGAQAAARGAGPRVSLVHFGRFYGVRTLGATLRALARLQGARGDLSAAVGLSVFGGVSPGDLRLAEELGVRGLLRVEPMRPYQEGLAALRAADALFLCDYDREEYFIPGKFFDYLRVGRPILALSANPELRGLVARLGVGETVHPDDEEGLAARLGRMIDEGARGALGFSPRGVEALRAEATARRLAETLREVAGATLP